MVSEPPQGTRLILASEDLLEMFGSRTDRGELITADWGEPSPEGWYTPIFTVHADDRLGELDAAWAEAEAALPEGWTLEMLEREPGGWQVVAVGRDFAETLFVSAATPSAALMALAAKLRARG